MAPTAHDSEPREAATILGAEDDPAAALLLEHALLTAGHKPTLYGDGEGLLAALETHLPDAVFLDINLPGRSGLEILGWIKDRHPQVPVIMLTSESRVETVVAAMQRGAFDYIVKPLDPVKLRTTLAHALEQQRLALRIRELERETGADPFPGIIGRSEAMRRLFRRMDRVAPSEISVLVHGETGTGKELVARALHARSRRARGPFVAINCAAIPESLQESELFGFEKGAFTGAGARHVGKVEQAHGGTLFLDEAGELSANLQAKLLRVLQERSLHRIGGQQEIKVDFRLVAATHRNLLAEVQAGRFREDLYFRIAVFELDLPPLRERDDDIELLAAAFLAEQGRAAGRPMPTITPAALAALRAHSWPGNVRELQNVIQGAVVNSDGPTIGLEELPERLRGGGAAARRPPDAATASPPRTGAAPQISAGPARAPAATMEEIERRAIAESLARHGGNVEVAARELGIPRTTLYRRIKRLGLEQSKGPGRMSGPVGHPEGEGGGGG